MVPDGETLLDARISDSNTENNENVNTDDETLPIANKRPKRSCPYLDTVHRNMLDFDFEKLCSISLLGNNVYACLVCGKYFQGRSPNTHAYIHSLELEHHVFINTETKKFYCLPDDYEVIDSSLDDIKIMLDPQLTDQEIDMIDKETIVSRTLDGHQYICGVVSLNSLNNADHINSSLQALAHLPKLRNFFFRESNYKDVDHPSSELVSRFGILVRKIWNPHNWRSHVSPHEFIQELSLRSNRKFSIGNHGNPLEFYAWMTNTCNHDLFSSKNSRSKQSKRQIFSDLFEGCILINTTKNCKHKTDIDPKLFHSGGQPHRTVEIVKTVSEQEKPFLYLQLDLPAIALYKDEKSVNATPQIPIYTLLAKYDGRTSHFIPHLVETRTYLITKLPKYLVLNVKRFSTNQFLTEKNKTIVNFPVQDLEMAEFTTPEAAAKSPTKYNLRAYICHNGGAEKGHYSARIHHQANNKWYDCQDLYISEILPEDHLLAEAYILFYERQDVMSGKDRMDV